jgi:LPS export ABC transporter permease LptG/LPS export ABC transporter permease LptF
MNKTLGRLLYGAIIPPFSVSFLVLTFVLFFQYIGSRSELLINRNASLEIILAIGAAVLPAIIIFSLPLAFLIGILIGFSGLSGESQITALRACGIPIRAMLQFVLALGLAVGCITAFFSTYILPRANSFVARMMDSVSLSLASSMVHPRVFNDDFPNMVLYIDDVAPDKQHWSRIFLADNTDAGYSRAIISNQGTWVNDPPKKRIQLHLDRGKSYVINLKDPTNDSISDFSATDIPISLKKAAQATSSGNLVPKAVLEQTTGFLWHSYKNAPKNQKIEQLVELNRRIALPFSIFPFAVMGLALAAGASSKGSRTSGFALSLVMVIVFYVLFFNGLRLASVGKISPFLGGWGANILLLVLGAALFTRVEMGPRFGFGSSKASMAFGRAALSVASSLKEAFRRAAKSKTAASVSNGRYARFRFPKVLDFYISRGFFVYFFWSAITCGSLFVLLTLFDLLDDIIRNNISVFSVLDYFAFLTPHILMIVIPVSVLLAILISFGIMEKNSEITAVKAGGWSLYRISIPVFLLAAGFCISLFLIQDYILPYANIRQENLRNVIKGRPPQSSIRVQRKWIFGQSGRIYNYEYFNSSDDSFVNLHIYETDLPAARLIRRTFASRANIDENGVWTLEDGWVRDYESPSPGFRKIVSEKMSFPERAGYFEREIFQPKESAKLRYFELKSYITYLKQSGYNATELQVELNKKISSPLSCIIMALLGIPFSFSMGKKGALWGIGASIAIAISFWGISGVFEALGSYGVLIPMLAAWAPNILFGAAGMALLLSVHT